MCYSGPFKRAWKENNLQKKKKKQGECLANMSGRLRESAQHDKPKSSSINGYSRKNPTTYPRDCDTCSCSDINTPSSKHVFQKKKKRAVADCAIKLDYLKANKVTACPHLLVTWWIIH